MIRITFTNGNRFPILRNEKWTQIHEKCLEKNHKKLINFPRNHLKTQ